MMCWGMKTYPVYSAIPTMETSIESELQLRKIIFINLFKIKSQHFSNNFDVEVPIHLVLSHTH